MRQTTRAADLENSVAGHQRLPINRVFANKIHERFKPTVKGFAAAGVFGFGWPLANDINYVICLF